MRTLLPSTRLQLFTAPRQELRLLSLARRRSFQTRANGSLSLRGESEGRGKTVKLAVSSLRIDTLAAAGLGISRQKVWEAALDNLLMLNGEVVAKKSASVVAGDVIDVDTVLKREEDEVSVVRRGRVKVVEIGERTKRGGYHVTVTRFKHFRTWTLPAN